MRRCIRGHTLTTLGERLVCRPCRAAAEKRRRQRTGPGPRPDKIRAYWRDPEAKREENRARYWRDPKRVSMLRRIRKFQKQMELTEGESAYLFEMIAKVRNAGSGALTPNAPC